MGRGQAVIEESSDIESNSLLSSPTSEN